jgi:hypothetical protein
MGDAKREPLKKNKNLHPKPLRSKKQSSPPKTTKKIFFNLKTRLFCHCRSLSKMASPIVARV